MGEAVAVDVELTTINCGECGGTYAINERYRKQKYDNGGFWTCPYCKTGWGYGESEIDRMKKEAQARERRLAFEQSRREAAEREREEAQRSARAYKGQTTRLKKRAAAGTCPCCHRTFKSVAIHMSKVHPDFVEEQRSKAS